MFYSGFQYAVTQSCSTAMIYSSNKSDFFLLPFLPPLPLIFRSIVYLPSLSPLKILAGPSSTALPSLSPTPISTTTLLAFFIFLPFLSNSSFGLPSLTFLGILVFAPSAHKSPQRAFLASRKACLLKLLGTVQRSRVPAGVHTSRMMWPLRLRAGRMRRGKVIGLTSSGVCKSASILPSYFADGVMFFHSWPLNAASVASAFCTKPRLLRSCSGLRWSRPRCTAR
jgi:hypothetical protein